MSLINSLKNYFHQITDNLSSGITTKAKTENKDSEVSKSHLFFFLLSMLRQFQSLKKKQQSSKGSFLIYKSFVLGKLELFLQFLFDMLGQDCRPLVLVFEVFIFFSRMAEYANLLQKERLLGYLSQEHYEEYKDEREEQLNSITLARSKRRLPKIAEFHISDAYKRACRLSQSTSSSSHQDENSSMAMRSSSFPKDEPHSFQQPYVKQEELPFGLLSGLDRQIKKVNDTIGIIRKKGSLPEVIGIAKPLVYLLAMMRYKHNSLYPVIIAGLFRLVSLVNLKERDIFQNKLEPKYREKELQSRKRAFLWKFFLDPAIYKLLTKRVIRKVLEKLRLPSSLRVVIEGIISYYRYYSFIL